MKHTFSLVMLLLMSSSIKTADDKRMPSIFRGTTTEDGDAKTLQRPLTPPVGFQKQDDDVSGAQKEKSISEKETKQQESDTDTTNKGPKKKKKKKKKKQSAARETPKLDPLPSVQESGNEDDDATGNQEEKHTSPLTPGTEMLQHNQELAARNASLARRLIDDLVAEDEKETKLLLHPGTHSIADAPTNADDQDNFETETDNIQQDTTDMESSLRASGNEGDDSDESENNEDEKEAEQPTCTALITFVAPNVRQSTTPSNSLDNSPTVQTERHSPIPESEHEDSDNTSLTRQESSTDSSESENEKTLEQLIQKATLSPDTALPLSAAAEADTASTTSAMSSTLTMTALATVTTSTMSAATSSNETQENDAQKLEAAASPVLSANTVNITQFIKDPRYENSFVQYAADTYEKIMKTQAILKDHKKKSIAAAAIFSLIGTYAILYKNGRTAPGMTSFAATFKACGSVHTFLSAHITEPVKTGVYKLYHDSIVDKGFSSAGNGISSAFNAIFPKIVIA